MEPGCGAFPVRGCAHAYVRRPRKTPAVRGVDGVQAEEPASTQEPTQGRLIPTKEPRHSGNAKGFRGRNGSKTNYLNKRCSGCFL